MEERPPDADLPDSGTVLITGPPMTGKYRLFVSTLSGHCERVGLVSTHEGAGELRADFRDADAGLPTERVGVIDCTRRPTPDTGSTDDLVSHVSSPMNLTEIGVKFTELADAFRSAPVDGRTGVGVYSVSQLLMFSNPETVYRFLRVLTGQLESNDWFGLAVLDETTIEDEAARTIENLFDGVIETRESEDGERQYRSRELGSSTTEWSPLPS